MMDLWENFAMEEGEHWEILFHREFDVWFAEQEKGLRRETWALLVVLARVGPRMGRPYVDTIEASAFRNMKELRVQYKGKPWRIPFAFDPNRNAVLLVGGTKVGKENWYDVHIPIADHRFAQYLSSLKKPKKE
jgi:hypothetical protein